MRKYQIMIVSAVYLFLINAGIGSALTKEESSFKGKKINFIVPHSPGGGFDLYARMISQTLRKYTGSTIVINNIPGAGGMIGVNNLYEEKPNGLNIALINGTAAVFTQMMGQKGLKYDLNRLKILGRLAASEEFIYVGAKGSYKTLEALLNSKDKETRWATEGKGGSPYYRVVLMCEILKLRRAKMMSGYAGSTEANLAIIRGDSDGTAGSSDSRQVLVDSKEFIPLLLLGKTRSKNYPKVPTIYEVPGLNDSDRRLADFLVGLDQLGRIMIAPPLMDQEKVSYLRTVFKKVCEDADLLKRAKKEQRELDYAPYNEVEKMVKDVLNAPPDVKKRIDEALKRYD